MQRHEWKSFAGDLDLTIVESIAPVEHDETQRFTGAKPLPARGTVADDLVSPVNRFVVQQQHFVGQNFAQLQLTLPAIGPLFRQCRLAKKVLRFIQRYREIEAAFERRIVRPNILPPVVEAHLEPTGVERVVAGKAEVISRSRIDDRG